MSGHSKWSSIKHKKGAADARRGKIFSKLIKEITVAARMGGGDPGGNPRLRSAIWAAKAENMPKDNIERAIKKGTGELEGTTYEETNYEGYGPGGVAVLVDCLTDNKNRAVAEVKHLFERHGGNLGEPGCVAWMFEKKGLIVLERDRVDEEKLL
jgi:YebC/PmpR family DNA-binding regulatory protein